MERTSLGIKVQGIPKSVYPGSEIYLGKTCVYYGVWPSCTVLQVLVEVLILFMNVSINVWDK